MQNGDNLHETSKPVFLKRIRKKSSMFLSAELAQRVVKVNLRY